MSQLLRGFAYAPVAIALMIANSTMAQSASQSRVGSVRVDCSAFKRTSATSWAVTKETIVPAGLKAYTQGQLDLPAGATIEPHLYQSNGVDLVDALDRKCAK